MAKDRVYMLARELGLESKVLLHWMKSQGAAVTSASAAVSSELAARVRSELAPRPNDTAAPRRHARLVPLLGLPQPTYWVGAGHVTVPGSVVLPEEPRGAVISHGYAVAWRSTGFRAHVRVWAVDPTSAEPVGAPADIELTNGAPAQQGPNRETTTAALLAAVVRGTIRSSAADTGAAVPTLWRLDLDAPEAAHVVTLRPASESPVPSQEHEVERARRTPVWQVRGHWRNQPCGPGGQDRRRIWVETHTQGPERDRESPPVTVYRVTEPK